MSARDSARVGLAVLAVCVALVLQTTAFAPFAWRGVVPDLVLLVVVAAGLVRGAQFGMVLGFVGGVLLDLAPPADHVAGRWALALLLAGYVAGLVRPDRPGTRPSVGTALPTVAACSLLASTTYAVSGLVLQDHAGTVPELLQVVLAALVWDLVLAVFVVPVVGGALTRLEPDRVPA